MSRMIRKQIYIEPRQEAFLKRRAEELGVSEAELIRRLLDSSETSIGDVEETDRLRAIEDVLAVMRDRAKLDVPQTGRDWTRDDIYEERLSRYDARHEHPGVRE